MNHPYVIADVFTDTPLEGNGLAVFTDATPFDDRTMARIAREMNLSETVFALPPRQDADAWIRIFTPGVELPFAGHPVLGSAFVLAGDRETIRLETGLGVVPVALRREGEAVVFGTMEQPIPEAERFEPRAALLAALGVKASQLPIEVYVNGPRNVYVALENEAAVAALAPDHHALAAVGPYNVSCFAGSGRAFKTRMFAPAIGVNEDPATGSAAGPLALHLARHGAVAFGEEIEIEQGAEIGRPSKLHARVDGSLERVERIEVGGAAVIVARGELSL
ncbi:MAG: PhzF family phenazine biosynthesis protein [Solirubrobacteraceae bacterium]|jgi:trans-2,3-dihydro-3-hydroxyanthranilate isomerase